MTRTSTDADLTIGRRVKALRLLKGVSQQQLGRAIGVTFQQVQKYEKGTNRLPVGRLVVLADAMGATLEELLGTGDAVAGYEQAQEVSAFLSEPGGVELMTGFLSIGNPNARRAFVRLVEEIAGSPSNAAT